MKTRTKWKCHQRDHSVLLNLFSTKKFHFHLINPSGEFQGKSPSVVAVLIKEQIARQMRDAGMDVSELLIHIRPSSEVQQEVGHTHTHMDPSHVDIVVQMHQQICRQVEVRENISVNFNESKIWPKDKQFF